MPVVRDETGLNIGYAFYDDKFHMMWIGRPIGGTDKYFHTELQATAYIRASYKPAPEVSTAGDLTIQDQSIDEQSKDDPLELWAKLGYKSYEEYYEAVKDRASIAERPEETQTPIEIVVAVDTIGWEQVNPLDPDFPDAPIIEVAEDNFLQAYYQISEGSTKYPSIVDVSSEGGSVIEATTRIPQVEDMPLAARIERAFKIAGQTWPVDPKIILAAVAVVLIIIGLGLSRR